MEHYAADEIARAAAANPEAYGALPPPRDSQHSLSAADKAALLLIKAEKNPVFAAVLRIPGLSC